MATTYGDLMVKVGATSFAAGEDWPGYIAGQLNSAIESSATGLAKLAQEHLQRISDYVETQHGSQPWNGQLVNDSNRLQRRTGGMIQSFKDRLRYTGGGTVNDVSATTDMGMFGIHMTGGTISARNAQYLTIPLPAACDRRGVPLYPSARDWPGKTFIMKSRRGNLLIMGKGPDGKLVPLYLLKTTVVIPARLQDFPKVWEADVDRMQMSMADEIEACIDAIEW